MKVNSVSICITAANAFCLPSLYASCTSSSLNINDVNIECTGDFQSGVSYGGADNYYVNINSSGNFIGSYNIESIFKIIGFENSASVNFDGSLNYDFYASLRNGASAGLGIGYNSNSAKKGAFVDFLTEKGSTLTMNVSNSSFQFGDQGGVMVGIRTDGGSGTGLVNVVHNGTLHINTSVDNRVGSSYGYAINSFSSNVNIINNGMLSVNSVNSNAGDTKLVSIENENKNGIANNVYFENNGELIINSQGGASNTGVGLYLSGLHESIILKNNGKMSIDSSNNVNMFYFESKSHESTFHVINSEGADLSVVGAAASTGINAREMSVVKFDNFGNFKGNVLFSTAIDANDTINNSGNLFGNIAMRGGDDIFNMVSGEFSGILYTNDGSDTINIYKGKFSSESVKLGDGDDIFNIYGGDLSGLQAIDAETGIDTINIYSNFSGSSLYHANDKKTTEILNFNEFNIMSGGTFTLDGDLLKADRINIMKGGELNLSPEKRNSLIDASVTNSGIINLDVISRDAGQTLTINGDYHGNNGVFLIDTQWFNSQDPNGYSISDKIIINGNATGRTRVVVKNEILGDVRLGDTPKISVPEIEVNGTVSDNAFWGYAQTANAGEAQLVFDPRRSVGSQFSWVLGTSEGEEILSPDVPGYVLSPYVNMEIVRDSISTYRDRIGGEYNRSYVFGGEKQGRAWGRMWHKHMKGNGERRLDWKSLSSGYQLGFQLEDKLVAGGSVRSDIYASYVTSSSHAYDRLSSEAGNVISNKYSGNMRTKNFNLGITRTFMGDDNGYKDFVVQFSCLKNIYTGRRGGKASNKAFATTLSFEQGKKFNVSDRVYVEPMYQVMASYLAFEDFNDGIRSVSQGKYWDGILRVGGRMYFRDPANYSQNNLVYMKAHYVHDFAKNGKAKIGKSLIAESNSNQWMEIGFGFQVNAKKNTYFFMDASMDRNLGGAYRNTYKANFGITHKW